MIKRKLELPQDRSCLLLGPRQTGKTTLVRASLPRDSWSVDLLSHDAAMRYSKDPSLFHREAEERLEAGTQVIFVDEVQKVPALLDEVHSLIEDRGARFILTGSSARRLRRGGANLLAGRARVRRLHPLTLGEMGDGFDLERVLRFGSLPTTVGLAPDDAADFLRAYAETYLREEVREEGLVRDLGAFGRFLDVLAAQAGETLNIAALARDASVAAATVKGYLEILEDTLLGFRLEAWRKSPRARLVAHSRFHLFDTGVTNALAQRLLAPPDRVLRGRLFEQWLVAECFRLVDYGHPETRIFYWRTNQGAEVDLLFERHGRLRAAVEIKGKPGVVGSDLRGLRSFAGAHPEVPRVVACLAPEPFRLEGVEVLPYARFLGELGRWLS